MDEATWLNATDPAPMLAFLRENRKASDRKLRAFACGCVRRIWPLLTEAVSRTAVEVAERFADGAAGHDELKKAHRAAVFLLRPEESGDARADASHAAVHTAALSLLKGRYDAPTGAAAAAAAAAAEFAAAEQATRDELASVAAWFSAREAERAAQADLLRDIFGPLPFRAAALAPSVLAWNDRLVVRLARAIYEERAFDRMGILADALLDAGCDNDEVVAHCREQGSHQRGCWSLDLLLGRP
jgi:hypothetical protein